MGFAEMPVMTMPSPARILQHGADVAAHVASMMELPLDQVERKVTFMRPEQGTPAPVSGPTPR